MTYYLVKVGITSVLIVLISEISKRNEAIGGLLASLPLVSLLAMIWIYVETKDVAKISGLATSVFWFIIPSLILFIVLPILLKNGLNFYLSLAISSALTIVGYVSLVKVLTHFDIKL